MFDIWSDLTKTLVRQVKVETREKKICLSIHEPEDICSANLKIHFPACSTFKTSKDTLSWMCKLGGLILIFFPICLLPIIYRLQFSKKSAYFFKPRGGLGRWLMRRGWVCLCPLNLRHVCPTMKNNWNEKFIVMWEVRNINLLSKQFIRTVNIWRAEKLQYVLVLCRLGSVRF